MNSDHNLHLDTDPFVEATSALYKRARTDRLKGVLAGEMFRGRGIAVGRTSVISSPLGGRTIPEKSDTTLTPLGAQHTAISGNREKKNTAKIGICNGEQATVTIGA